MGHWFLLGPRGAAVLTPGCPLGGDRQLRRYRGAKILAAEPLVRKVSEPGKRKIATGGRKTHRAGL